MTTSPLPPQVSYTSNQSAQQDFQSNYNLADPTQSINSYMRSIHQYTKTQLDTIHRSKSSRRTEASPTAATATLTPESSVGSVESVKTPTA
ncbi:MAG: hypothetical protein LQ339_008097 [Xanthoria mediterranea]|nr:MAG: hypothetical protein LQ339_008097 [Xanthoria mediterranea]